MGRRNCNTDIETTTGQALRTDQLSAWMESEWLPQHPDQDLQIVVEDYNVLHQLITERFDRREVLPGGYVFAGEHALENDLLARVSEYRGGGQITSRTGAFVYHFAPVLVDDDVSDGATESTAARLLTASGNGKNGANRSPVAATALPTPDEVSAEPEVEAPPPQPDPDRAVVQVLVMGAYFTDEHHRVTLAAVPRDFMPAWAAFAETCGRLSGALDPEPKVRVIGGRGESFEPTVAWDDIVLPESLKDELLADVESFFTKGIEVYRRLNLKPFRKLLLAGVPGTGKTMLCSALARWALERDFLVIYISSNDYSGAAFWKIEQALRTAANSELPTIVLLEELDAYVADEDEKALVLNVLDGTEAKTNQQGTLLVGTTNYPEAIDERVLKRPGRLDRIFIIPETRRAEDAEKMLRTYLRELWQPEHMQVAHDLVGYPGAFIREVAIYAITQMAFQDLEELPLDLLRRSFDRLLDQITARDDFLTRHRNNGFGFVVTD